MVLIHGIGLTIWQNTHEFNLWFNLDLYGTFIYE